MRHLATWEREFSLWDYSVSYSRLLLRSLRDASPSRVDILFSNVVFMHLPAGFQRMQIEMADGRHFAGVDMSGPAKGNWYVMNGGESFVFATHCQWHEDEGNFKSASRFGPFNRTE
jgi:hypothetical protein